MSACVLVYVAKWEEKNCLKFLWLQTCPFWSEFSNFTACSVTCGVGIRSRFRICLFGDPGDAGCSGAADEQEQCFERVKYNVER